jgi:diguanylate cyclase (GGDEF)-like protein
MRIHSTHSYPILTYRNILFIPLRYRRNLQRTRDAVRMDSAMKNIDSLLALIRQNEDISRKFNEIETQILSTLNFAGLFEILLTQIREKFQIPYVWISLIDSGEVPDLIHSLGKSEILKAHLRIIDPASFMKLIPDGQRPLLVNDNLERFSILYPENRNYLVKSMAVTPITLDGAIIGSLNQADFSCDRFAPGMDTSLLESLARKVSLCLANVTSHEKLSFLAYHDPLTGLLNRRVMESILEREYLRGKRYSSPVSVVFLDLDKFKVVNDSLGHNVGDELLRHTAKSLAQLVRNSDVVARFAGDEFVIILPETDPQKANNMMDRIQSHFEENPLRIRDHTVAISISYGVASSEEPGVIDPSSLLSLADKRLYKMKGQKTNSKLPTQNHLT